MCSSAFVIRDTGIGMSQEFIKRLYTPFEQATSSTASKFGGTGLGMAITKNLVSLLGGTIFVKSEEGRGTEFTVELPFGLSGRQLEKGKGELEPLKVLVVDVTTTIPASTPACCWIKWDFVPDGCSAVRKP